MALSAVIWLVLSLGNSENTKTIPLRLVAPSPIVEGYVLSDTVTFFDVTVKARGLNALRMGGLDLGEIELKDGWLNAVGENRIEINAGRVLAELDGVYNGAFQFSTTDESVYFSCEKLAQKRVGIEVRGLDKIILAREHWWVEELHVAPDSVTIQGAAQSLTGVRVVANVPAYQWEGAEALKIPLQLQTDEQIFLKEDVVQLRGRSALWTERRYVHNLVLGQQVHEVECWLAGPAGLLADVPLKALCTIENSSTAYQHQINLVPKFDDISVLSIQPNTIEIEWKSQK